MSPNHYFFYKSQFFRSVGNGIQQLIKVSPYMTASLSCFRLLLHAGSLLCVSACPFVDVSLSLPELFSITGNYAPVPVQMLPGGASISFGYVNNAGSVLLTILPDSTVMVRSSISMYFSDRNNLVFF